MISIRRYLLVSVLSIVAVSGVAVTYLTYINTQNEFYDVFDQRLKQSARILRVVFFNYLDHVGFDELDFEKVQSYLIKNWDKFRDEGGVKKSFGDQVIHRYSRLVFQVTQGEKVLMRTPNAPVVSFSPRKSGLNVYQGEGHTWHIYSLSVDEALDLRVTVGERYDLRDITIRDVVLEADSNWLGFSGDCYRINFKSRPVPIAGVGQAYKRAL